jgi:hypothetical protein
MPAIAAAQSRARHRLAAGSVRPKKGTPAKAGAREFVGGIDIPPKQPARRVPAPAKAKPAKKKG